MDIVKTPHLTKAAWALAVLLVCYLGAVLLCIVTIWTIEHYMDITPPDWPYPGSFWDRANDFACGTILLPSGSVGRFCFFLVFFPVPILVELRRQGFSMAALYLVCVFLPDYVTSYYHFNAFGSTAYLLIILFLFPVLIHSWTWFCTPGWERTLIRVNLVALWLGYIAAAMLLGFGFHGAYCKVGFLVPFAK